MQVVAVVVRPTEEAVPLVQAGQAAAEMEVGQAAMDLQTLVVGGALESAQILPEVVVLAL